MDTNSLVCKICSYQFGKKLVYDIHMSFVHKIEIDPYIIGKSIQIKQEDFDKAQEEFGVNPENNLMEQNDFKDEKQKKETVKMFNLQLQKFL